MQRLVKDLLIQASLVAPKKILSTSTSQNYWWALVLMINMIVPCFGIMELRRPLLKCIQFQEMNFQGRLMNDWTNCQSFHFILLLCFCATFSSICSSIFDHMSNDWVNCCSIQSDSQLCLYSPNLPSRRMYDEVVRIESSVNIYLSEVLPSNFSQLHNVFLVKKLKGKIRTINQYINLYQ